MVYNIHKPDETMELLYADRGVSGDVTFLVESERIQAHWIVLAATSPKYEVEFDAMDSNQDEIPVPNVTAAAFKAFLQFFYKEKVDLTMDIIDMVLELAKQSQVIEFVESCLNFLKESNKSNKSLCTILRLAILYDDETLRLDCEPRIARYIRNVFASAEFLCCDRGMLMQILKMDALNCNEVEVFDACIAWARAECKRINLDGGKPENLRAALGDAIYQIRFSSFKTDAFADLHKSMEGLFTAEESIELFYMVGMLKNFKSRKFNQIARASPSLEVFDERKTVWSVEIDRFVRKNELPSFQSVHIGRVTFESICEIHLHGIALGVRFDQADLDHFPERCKIRLPHRFTQLWGEVKFKVFQSPTHYDESFIMFEPPIWVDSAISCDFRLPAKELNYELTLKRSVQEHGVDFTFDSAWLTRVFYDEIVRPVDYEDW